MRGVPPRPGRGEPLPRCRRHGGRRAVRSGSNLARRPGVRQGGPAVPPARPAGPRAPRSCTRGCGSCPCLGHRALGARRASGFAASVQRLGLLHPERRHGGGEQRRQHSARACKRGGQPGHQGKGPARDPDPDQEETAEPPAECRSCAASLDGAAAGGSRWAQVIDVEFIRKVTEWALPGLSCPCCETVTFAGPPAGAHAGAVSYGPPSPDTNSRAPREWTRSEGRGC
jgi:hypothetical protein